MCRDQVRSGTARGKCQARSRPLAVPTHPPARRIALSGRWVSRPERHTAGAGQWSRSAPWTSPLSTRLPKVSVLAAAITSAPVRPATTRTVASGSFGFAIAATVEPLIEGRGIPPALATDRHEHRVTLGGGADATGKLAPRKSVSLPNHDATIAAACRLSLLGSLPGRRAARASVAGFRRTVAAAAAPGRALAAGGRW